MKPVIFTAYHDRNCERMSARHSLTFHLDGMFIIDHDDDREAREATEAEQTLWTRLVGDFDPEEVPTTVEELRSCWQYRDGPFTVSDTDAWITSRLVPPEWVPKTHAQRLQTDLLGYFQGKPVYVSRAIQVGYFYEGPRIPEIHAESDADLAPEIILKVYRGLHPFMTECF